MNELLREYFGSNQHREYDLRDGGIETNDEAYDRFMRLGGDLLDDKAVVVTGGFERRPQGASTVEPNLLMLLEDQDDEPAEYSLEEDIEHIDNSEGEEYRVIGADDQLNINDFIEGGSEIQQSPRYNDVDEFIKNSGVFDN